MLQTFYGNLLFFLAFVLAIYVLLLVRLGVFVWSERRAKRRALLASAQKARLDRELLRESAHLKQSDHTRLRAMFADDPHLLEMCAPVPAIRRGMKR